MIAELTRDQKKQRILNALQRRRERRPDQTPRSLPAMAIARALGIRPRGNRGSRRRGVRILIRELREHDGQPILMDQRGYYLGQDAADYQRAEAHARRSGLSQLALGATIRHHPEHHDATGQLTIAAALPSDRRSISQPASSDRRAT